MLGWVFCRQYNMELCKKMPQRDLRLVDKQNLCEILPH